MVVRPIARNRQHRSRPWPATRPPISRCP